MMGLRVSVTRHASRSTRGAPVLIGPEHLQLEARELPTKKAAKNDPRPSTSAVTLSEAGMTLKDAVEETKRIMVLRAVEQNGGNWAAAARSLGMAPSNPHHMATGWASESDDSPSISCSAAR